MTDDLAPFSSPELKGVVQDIRELLSQSRIAFLFGAGCSRKAGLPLMQQLTEEITEHDRVGKETKDLLESMQASFDGARSATIEDYMSELVDLLSIVERRAQRGATNPTVPIGGREVNVAGLKSALDEIKEGISAAIGEREVDTLTHRQLVRAIHGSLQAGKKRRAVDYFVLNYDTLLEDALGLEQVAYCDGFSGTATGWWEPATFEATARGARVFKLHGSIDWCLLEDDSLPRRLRPGLKTTSRKGRVLIYPAATKYREAQRDPFAQMAAYLRRSLCPPEGSELVLTICGYSFADAHVDFEIENGLHRSEGRLTIAAFVSTEEPEGKLAEWVTDPAVSDQIRIYTPRGYYHGAKDMKLRDVVPWWKFEVLARLLGGER